MDLKEIIYWFSDGRINECVAVMARDFKVISTLVGAPLLWFAFKIVKKTPWKSDDQLLQKVADMLGVKNE